MILKVVYVEARVNSLVFRRCLRVIMEEELSIVHILGQRRAITVRSFSTIRRNSIVRCFENYQKH